MSGNAQESGGGEKAPRPHVTLFDKRIPIPRSRLARLAGGTALVILGLFGFLPVLGFWMIPLGFLILSYDIAAVRRLRRRIGLWWSRRFHSGAPRSGGGDAT